MNYTELTIKDTTYKLRLNTRACVSLEKTLGRNPLEVFMELDAGKLPKISDIIAIFHVSLQSYQHNMSVDKVYDLYDDYLEEGHTMVDIITVFVEVFQEAGLIPKTSEGEEDEAKNA